MTFLARILLLLCLLGSAGVGVRAQEPAPADRLTGKWGGEATFLLPKGITKQVHTFVFDEVTGKFVTGKHGWDIPARNLKSHDGKEWTYTATEPFLGVVAEDRSVWLVEIGDRTMFRLRLIDQDTLEFIALESGAHPIVGHGKLKRK